MKEGFFKVGLLAVKVFCSLASFFYIYGERVGGKRGYMK